MNANHDFISQLRQNQDLLGERVKTNLNLFVT